MRDHKIRYTDLAIQFRLKDGPNAGKCTRPYGGRWDRKANKGAGKYIGYWDPLHGWVGEPCEKIHTTSISQQTLSYITDFNHRVILALGGRRSGKSAALACKAVILCCVMAGRQGAILSPTYRQAKNVWRHVLRIVPRWWLKPGRYGIRWSEKRLVFVNGASIVLISADKEDGSRSEGSAWWGRDEMQDIKEGAAASSFLSTSEGGKYYIIFETATIKPELRDHFDRVNQSSKGSVYYMDSYGNPFISHEFLRDAEEFMDAAMVDQEIHSRWPDLVGRIYYPFKLECIRSFPVRFKEDSTKQVLQQRFDGPPAYTKEAYRYFISIDPPHHAVVWGIYSDGTMHAIDEIVIGSDGTHGDIRDLAQACSRFCPAIVVIDPHDTKYSNDVRKWFRRYEFRMTSLKRIEPEYRITAVRARMERNKFFVDPRCVHLIEALENHQYIDGKPDKDTKYKKVKAPGSSEIEIIHILDAMGYGVYKLFPAKFNYEKEERLAA